MFGSEGFAAEISPLAVLLSSVSNVSLRRIEADVVYLGQPVEVIRRPAANIEDSVPGLKLCFVGTVVADQIGADTLLQGDIQSAVSKGLPKDGEHYDVSQ